MKERLINWLLDRLGVEVVSQYTAEDGSTAIEVVHVDCGHRHGFSCANLRVVLGEEDGLWYAQGVEIDYAAGGDSLEDVKERFIEGLQRTIQMHIERSGSVDELMTWAPQEAWESMAVEDMTYSMVSFAQFWAETDAKKEVPPFDRVTFIQPVAQAA